MTVEDDESVSELILALDRIIDMDGFVKGIGNRGQALRFAPTCLPPYRDSSFFVIFDHLPLAFSLMFIAFG
jgi:hypothetical protein